MLYKKANQLIYCLVIAVLNLVLQPVLAAAPTILETSIKWEDELAKIRLLEPTPKWSQETIKILFDAYGNPKRFLLTDFKDTQKYNTQFINAFWGPINNPFTKYPRPVKAFVFVNKAYFMAPLIQNASDNNYYVFDKNQKQPLLLKDWVNNIKNSYGPEATLSFNICNGYGDLPTDSCKEKTYQASANVYKSLMKKSDDQAASAIRGINEDWRSKVPHSAFMNESSVHGDSVSWLDLNARQTLLNTVTTWPNYNVIKDNFEKMRDIRYFQDEQSDNFLRRITWLYPDDGCWTRASAAIKDLFGPINSVANQFSRPSKVFAFGNLCANTPNSPTGKVVWWYHTAPVIRDAHTKQTYVLDPAVSPLAPIAIEKWMEAISARTGACKDSRGEVALFNICNGYGATPSDSCEDKYVNFASETDHMIRQRGYRSAERHRQLVLERDPNKVLGDSPPWLGS